MRAGSSKIRRTAGARPSGAWGRVRVARVLALFLSRGVPPAVPRRHAQKRLDHLRVELRARVPAQLDGRALIRLTASVDAVAGDGVEGVGNREDPRVQVNPLATQPQGVARPVPPLVVLGHDAGRALQEL